ncbi:Sushi domain-containing protein 2 [Collichthys lucidus]|uniref:Sushi domain-containing protein 2 n=1 Tax=Collichthys lucidus TaxID=240159 RepID=A0A4U5UXQ9_COLLU|nr:Sushi domain-containing protein 2 [Collichthys lucidus]
MCVFAELLCRLQPVLFPGGALLQLHAGFKGEIEREGLIDSEGNAYCISPLLYETGWIPFAVSTDGIHFDRSGEYLSVHPSKAELAFEVTLVNGTQWQNYGTPNVAGWLKMRWNSSLIGAERVNIELWGYREFSRSAEAQTNGSSSLQAKLRYLYSVGKNVSNTGAFSFIPEPSQEYSDWELGNIRITASSKSDGARLTIVVTLRVAVCALITQVVSTASEQFRPGNHHGFPDTPTGYTTSLVSTTAACCLITATSTSIIDLLAGVSNYRPPRAGVVLGDLHFITFDGLGYTFNGKGEYLLVSSPDRQLSVQARTEQVKLENFALAKATWVSSVAMKEKASDVIEVRRAEGCLQVLRNQKVLPFTEESWMDLHVLRNVTVIFLSGAGVEVRVHEGAMAVTVLLPTEFTNHTQGLLGLMNSDPSDDLLTHSGEVISSADATPEEILTFGASWNISKESSLFAYDSKYLLDTYFFPPSHDPAFVPAFSLPEGSDDPLVADMLKICFGEGATFCKYDTLTTRSLKVGNATLRAYQNYQTQMAALEPVVSCGWLSTPMNGRKNGTHYLEGNTVSFTCNEGYILYGSTERTCLDDGTWTGEQPYCITDSPEIEHSRAERERLKWVVNAGSTEEGVVEMPTKSCIRLLNQSRSLSVSHF